MAAVGIAALAVRLAYLAGLSGSPFFLVLVGDGREYDAWAQRIAAGAWLGSGAFFQSPLYPYLMAVLYAVAGHRLWLVRLAQSAGGAGACVLLCDAGRSFVGRRAGLAAGALLAVYPEALFFDGLIQKASLDLLLMALFLALAGRYLCRPRAHTVVALGAALGLVMLNRENARVLFPLLAGWLWVAFPAAPRRLRAQRIGLMAIGTLIVLLPVAVRNAAVSGEWFVSTSQGGYNFYLGNHAGANGSFEPLVPGHGNVTAERDDSRRLAEQAEGRPLTDGEISNFWFRQAFTFIRAHPGRWLALTGRKLLMVVNAGEFSDTDSIQEYARYSAILRLLRWFNFGVLLAGAAAGLWWTRQAWRRLWLLYATAATLLLSVVAFYVYSRYRYPVVPALLLFDGAAIAAIPQMVRAPRRAMATLAVTAAVALLTCIPLTEVVDITHLNVGNELVQEGRAAEAVPILRQAVAICPADPAAHFGLGVALARSGAVAASVDELAQAARMGPPDAKTLAALGASLSAVGRADEARAVFERAVAIDPASPQARTNYAAALWAAGAHDAAVAQYGEAAKLNPQDAGAQNNLAVALQQTGQLAEAIPHYYAAIALNPADGDARSNLALALADDGRSEAAVGQFREAIRLDPQSFAIHSNFGDLLARLGNEPAASVEYEAAFRTAASNVPNVLTVIPRLARAYAATGQRDRAMALLTQGRLLATQAGETSVAKELASLQGQIRNSR